MRIEQPGPDKFTELSDVPHSYAGAASQNVTVTIGEDGLEFTSGGGGGAVDSVNGQTGVVVLDTADIAEAADFNYVSDAQLVVITNTSGVNTGDQNLFRTIAVAGQSDVIADSPTDTLTLAAGSNVTITTDAATDTVTISASGGGGGSFAITETEIDFGTVGTDKPVVEKTFTITNASITPTSKIIATESGATATGRQDGDSLWDSISYACTPATGSFTLFAKASGSVIGKRKVNYSFA